MKALGCMVMVVVMTAVSLGIACAQEATTLPTAHSFQMTCRIEKRPLELRIQETTAPKEQKQTEQESDSTFYRATAVAAAGRVIQDEEVLVSESGLGKTIIYRLYER